MTLTEIRARLGELGVHPSRRLGQNFLHDQNLARRIVELAELAPDHPALEIGPGLGALTEFIPSPARLTLIEKDHRLAAFLRNRFPDARVIEGDALDAIRNPQFAIRNSIVLGNLPYSVASPLIVRLCEPDLRPRRMVFTVQREVAERLVARARTRDYGLLTLLTQPFYEIRIARKLAASVFWPEPQVSSAVVAMQRREVQPFAAPESENRFRTLLHVAWQKRRKKMGTIFHDDPSVRLDREKRPEELTVAEWTGAVEPEERFDVVNERDEVIGQEARGEVHRRRLRHRAVHIFIWNRHGELLLQKRAQSKDVAPGAWDSSAAGHLSVGEEYDAAAARECQEELGIGPVLRLIDRHPACAELGWEFVRRYETRSEGPFHFPPSEVSEVRWWKPEEIDAAIRREPAIFAGSFRYLWEKARC